MRGRMAKILYGTGGDYLPRIRLILTCGKVDANQALERETVDLIIRNNMGDSRVTLPPALSNDAEFFPARR